MSVDFIVLGLPRSGTTWLANWLTTDTTLCLHDPFNVPLDQWPQDARRRGISCTGAYLLPEWLKRQQCPVAVIQRDVGACDASLAGIGYPATTPHMQAMLDEVEGRRFDFADVWDEDEARDVWAFLLPGVAFDAIRYRLLAQMQIQPHMGKWTPNHELIRRMDAPQES